MITDMLASLASRWELLWHEHATADTRREILDQLIAAYTAPQRHYHDLRHVAECLREFDSVRHLAANPQAVEAAIWFHDVVYDGHRQDNEERSAEWAEESLQRLGASAALRAQVRDLVLFTRHDRPPVTADGKLMVDIDLASLGFAPDIFDANGRAIRREYPHVPEADFLRGRAALLGRFLDRPRIYLTEHFFAHYEQQARQNLQRTLSAIDAT